MAFEQIATFNPKKHRLNGNQSKSSSFNFARAISPITLEIQDTDEIRKAFKEFPLIPYSYEYSLLPFLNGLRYSSPTLGSCHESIKSYAFGSKLDIVYLEDEDFCLNDDIEDVDITDKKLLVAFVKEFVSLGEITSYTQLAENMYDDFKGNGNYFLELVHTETDGVLQSTIHYHHSETAQYWATAKNQPKMIALSQCWDYEYLKKNKPPLIATYPNYNYNKKTKTYRTIIHVKNGNFRWYGRPDWVASMRHAYKEFVNCDYLIKMSNNQFTGQVFIEIEEDDIENDSVFGEEDIEGFDNVIDKIEQNFTAKADDPQTVMITTRPNGASKAFIYQFKPNTNEKFFKSSDELDRRKIIEANQWSERLLGNSVAEGFSTDSHMSELKAKESSVLKRYRNKILYGLNLCLNEIFKFHKREDLNPYGFSFKSSIKEVKGETNSIKDVLDAVGVGARAGVITPNIEDEAYFRTALSMPPPNEFTKEAWDEDGNFRRPITLKGSADSETEQIRNDKPKTTRDDSGDEGE